MRFLDNQGNFVGALAKASDTRKDLRITVDTFVLTDEVPKGAVRFAYMNSSCRLGIETVEGRKSFGSDELPALGKNYMVIGILNTTKSFLDLVDGYLEHAVLSDERISGDLYIGKESLPKYHELTGFGEKS